MVRMHVYKVGVDPQRRVPFVILADETAKRLMPIYIGPFEANAIAAEIQGQTFPRPMTHDLLRAIIETLGYAVTRVMVTKLEDQTFFAAVILVGDGRTLEIDARPSDAIALGLRCSADLYVAESVLAQAGFLADEAQFSEGEEEARSRAEELKKFRDLLEGLESEDVPGSEEAEPGEETEG